MDVDALPVGSALQLSARRGVPTVVARFVHFLHSVDASGLTGLEADKPIQVLTMDGAILIKCSENVGQADVYDMAGRLVLHIDNLADDMIIDLPRGIYLLKTSTCRQAWKVAVK